MREKSAAAMPVIRAEDSRKISAFDDMTLVQLILERGVEAIEMLPENLRRNESAAAETIENNLRKVIIDEQPINPKYYDAMSDLLDALIRQRREEAIDYQEYLRQIVALTQKIKKPSETTAYPASVNSEAKRSLYDNLDKNEALRGKRTFRYAIRQPCIFLPQSMRQRKSGRRCCFNGIANSSSRKSLC